MERFGGKTIATTSIITIHSTELYSRVLSDSLERSLPSRFRKAVLNLFLLRSFALLVLSLFVVSLVPVIYCFRSSCYLCNLVSPYAFAEDCMHFCPIFVHFVFLFLILSRVVFHLWVRSLLIKGVLALHCHQNKCKENQARWGLYYSRPPSGFSDNDRTQYSRQDPNNVYCIPLSLETQG